ncbi:MAG: glycosyltransferase family 87 protein [Gemmatales bacterium]
MLQMLSRDYWTWPRIRQTLIVLLAVLLVIKAVIAVGFRENDFTWHRNGGARFLKGTTELYENYPVVRMMMNTLIAIGPSIPTRLVVFCLSVGLLLLCYRWWRVMAKDQGSLSPLLEDLAALGAAVMFLQILYRDLDECGLQLITLFFLTAGAYSLHRGKAIQGGFWLAVAALYKLSPILTLPFLLWKRQWKAATAQVVFIGLLSLLPALYLGVDGAWKAHQAFFTNSRLVAATKAAYPYYLDREAPKPQNQSLQAMIARYVMHFPEDHPVYQPSPLFLQFGNLEGLPAYYTVRAIMLVLGLGLAWYFWPRGTRLLPLRRGGREGLQHAVSLRDPDPLQLPLAKGESRIRSDEWAIVCLMCALGSPFCWKQHLVVGLPLAYLAMRQLVLQPTRARLVAIATLTVVILVPIYSLLGRQGGILWASYKFECMAMLGLMGMVMVGTRRCSKALPGESELPQLKAA